MLIAKGKKKGKSFKLDASILELKFAMFSKSHGIVYDIDICGLSTLMNTIFPLFNIFSTWFYGNSCYFMQVFK